MAASPVVRIAVEQGKAQALTLLKEGKNEAAYDLYIRLLREEPGDDHINLGLARAAVLLGRYTQALLAYERMVDKYPRHAPLRLELARVYVKLNDVDGARRELAAAQLYDPSLTLKDIDRLVATLKTQESRWRSAGRLTVGMVYDSNVNTGMDSRSIVLGGWNLYMDPAVQKTASWGSYTQASLTTTYRLGAESPWWLSGDVTFYAKDYFDETPSNNTFLWGRGSLGLRYVGQRAFLDVRLKAEQAEYDPYQIVTVTGPEVSVAYSVTSWLQILTRGAYEDRKYLWDIGRDGSYLWLGQYARLFWGTDNHELMLGARYMSGNANVDDNDYSGWEASARTVFKLPFNAELSPFVTWRKEFYAGPATVLEKENRQDDNLRAGAFLTVRWNDFLSSEFGYQYMRNKSTCPLYDYSQHMINMGMTISF